MWQDFKEFALRGNVLDMAVGIIIGAAFATIARSLVDDIVMPPIGLVLGNVEFKDLFMVLKEGEPVGPYLTLEQARGAGAVVIAYGFFTNNVVTFFLVAFAVFLIVKAFNALRRREEEKPSEGTTRNCPHCLSMIPRKATKCAHCTADLAPTV